MYRKLLHLLYETGPSLLAKYIVTFGKRRDRVNSCVNYQPLPWIGLNQSRRTQGTLERWELMKPFIRTPGSLLDIGCSVGYFVFKAAEMGCLAWGVDSDLESHVLSNYAKKKANFDNVQFFKGVISTNDVETLPRFDYILYLSVFPPLVPRVWI